MKELILYCDFLGFKPSLHVQNENNFKSVFTGLLSILIALVSLLCAGYFGSELITHITPTVIIATENDGILTPIQVSNQGFLFFLGLEYENFTYYVDPTIFEVGGKSQKISNIKSADGSVQQIVENKDVRIDLCSNFYTDDDIDEKNIKIPLDKFYCAEPNAVAIEGFWGSTTSPYVNLRVEFKKCKNSTENNFHCKSSETINSIIQNGYLSVDFTTFDVDPKNYTNPIKRMLINDYNLLNANSSLEYSIDIFPLKFKSDDGLVFKNDEILNGFLFNQKIFNRNTPTDFIVSFVFQGNPTTTAYLRSYVKLQTVLTQIGGFIKAIMLAGSLLSYLFSENYYFILYLSQISNLGKNNGNCDNEDKSIAELKNTVKRYSLSNNNVKAEIKVNKELYDGNKLMSSINNQFAKDSVLGVKEKELDHLQIIKSSKFTKMESKKKVLASHNIIQDIKIDKNLYLVLMNYLWNLILVCRSKKNKSRNFKLVTSIRKIYRKFLSVDQIIRSSLEIELMRNEFDKMTGSIEDENLKKLFEDKILKDANL